MFESRCGVACGACRRKEQVHCTGCCSMAAPFWGAPCAVKSCCEGKKLDHCGRCPSFPCELVAHMGEDKGFDPAPRLALLCAWREEGNE